MPGREAARPGASDPRGSKGPPGMRYWTYKTRIGTFAILPMHGAWAVLLGNEHLGGGYVSPLTALEDLVGGHTFFPSCGVDPSRLSIPDDLSDWAEHRR